MRLKEKYIEKIESMADSDLQTELTNRLTNEKMSISQSKWKLDCLLDEAMKRDESIYIAALNDSEIIFSNYTERMNSLDEANIVKIEQSDASLPGELNAGTIEAKGLTMCIVHGDSMINDNLFEGDVLIVDSNFTEYSGKIAVVSINSNLFVKRIKIIDGKIWLCSSNPKYLPVKVTEDEDFKILGLVKYKLNNVI